MPSILRRAFDAFGAGDPFTIGEVFERHAVMTAHVDARLVRLFGGEHKAELPLRSRGNLRIAQHFELNFANVQVGHVDVHSAIRAGREVAAVCEFDLKILATGETFAARCTGIYTLSATGRKVENARTVCQLITPGWDHKLN